MSFMIDSDMQTAAVVPTLLYQERNGTNRSSGWTSIMKQSNKLKDIFNINENKHIIKAYKFIIDNPARLLAKMGISPDFLTFIGLLFGLGAAVFVVLNNFLVASILFITSLLADAFDGAVARHLGTDSIYGDYLDAVLDRYVDMALLLSLCLHFALQDQLLPALLAALAIIGVAVTSYSKAKAEALGIEEREVGLMNRAQRCIILAVGLFFPQTIPILLWPLAVLTNITAVHRIVYYASQLLQKTQNEKNGHEKKKRLTRYEVSSEP